MGLEEYLLSASIAETIHEGRKAAEKLSNLYEYNTPDNTDDGPHAEEIQEAELVLNYYVRKAYRDTGILAERLGLTALRSDISRLQRSHKNLANLVPSPFDVGLQCEPLADISEIYRSMAVMTEKYSTTGIGVFETTLENTAKIINDAGIAPDREAEVREQVFRVLGYSFRDVIRELPIAKSIKTYRPDIGVPSLMAAAEYKFIDNKGEAKKALDETYADMKGYNGHHDWRHFYAVYYMTDAFYTQKDVENEYQLVKAELNWKPIVIVGAGSRKKKVVK